MPITPNAIDLTTLAKVKNWIQIPVANTTDDQTIQDAITSFSAYALRITGRGPADGSIPAASPLVVPVAYDEFYDGSGTETQQVRNWPIVSVASVNVNGQPIPQSTGLNVSGWVVNGDAKFISIRGGLSANVATFQNYRFQTRGAGGRGGFCAGIQNVEIAYTAGFNGTPFDLEFAARKIVSLNYKRKDWIGQRSQQMANGAGSTFYNDWEMDRQDERTIRYYARRVA